LPFSSAFPIARASAPRREPHADDVIACCAYVSAGMRPIHHVALALRVSFPDRSLIQWDSGKFHELAPLLRRLKNGAHRCLIFT
jgi:helicase SWR1